MCAEGKLIIREVSVCIYYLTFPVLFYPSSVSSLHCSAFLHHLTFPTCASFRCDPLPPRCVFCLFPLCQRLSSDFVCSNFMLFIQAFVCTGTTLQSCLKSFSLDLISTSSSANGDHFSLSTFCSRNRAGPVTRKPCLLLQSQHRTALLSRTR